MRHWFQKQLISEASALWINECSNWIIGRYGDQAFAEQTKLVTPDSQYFPKPVTSQSEMATYLLERITELAGINHLNWVIQSQAVQLPAPNPSLRQATHSRFQSHAAPPESHPALTIPYVAEQTKKPQDMIANIATLCSQHLLWQAQDVPPGGGDYFLQSAELMAIFFGFGIMMVNSAYTFRGSCAKCHDPRANRQANLSEAETLFALALFCQKKAIPGKQVLPHLKSHLRGDFKIALRQASEFLA